MRHHLIPSPAARAWFQHPAYQHQQARKAAAQAFRPATNIRETDEGYEISVAVPGRKKEDFKVELQDQLLVLRADQPKDENSYKRREFTLKGFERRFELPETVDASGITAAYKQGILVLSLPKKPEAKPQPPRQIDIA